MDGLADQQNQMYQNISEERMRKNSLAFKVFIGFLTLSFFAATPVAAAVTLPATPWPALCPAWKWGSILT